MRRAAWMFTAVLGLTAAAASTAIAQEAGAGPAATAAQCYDDIDNDLDGQIDECSGGREFGLLDNITGGIQWLPVPVSTSHGSNMDFSNGLTGWQTIGQAGSAAVADGEMVLTEKTVRQSLGQQSPGSWRIAAQLNTENVADGGYRICLEGTPHPWAGGRFCSEIVSGTGEFLLEAEGTLTAPENMYFKVEAYSRPTGTARVAEVTLVELVVPEPRAFLKYPNYRGVLEGDEIRLEIEGSATVALETLGGTRLTSVETNGGAVALDASGMGEGYHVIRTIGDTTEYPPYAVIRGDPPIDAYNRFQRNGEPYIPIGVYDSGLGYAGADAAAWRAMLRDRRRLWELNPDIYLNYHYGGAPPEAMTGLMDALQGGLHFQTANCFNQNEYVADRFRAQQQNDPSFLPEVSTHPGFGGVYVMDECVQKSATQVFDRGVQWFRRFPGFNLGVSNRPQELHIWKDIVDIQGVDPYPIHDANGPHDWARVTDWVSAARDSVHDARPVVAVLQFLQITSKGRWPTQKELESMGLSAIAEGADAIVFWSIGNGRGALFWSTTCSPQVSSSEWCPERNEYFNRLKGAFATLRQVPPGPNVEVPTDNEQVRAVRKGHALIIYNLSRETQTATVAGKVVQLGEFEAILAPRAGLASPRRRQGSRLRLAR